MAYEQKIEVNLGHRPGLKSMRQLDPAAAAQARVENTGFSLEAVRGRRTSRPQDLAGRNGFNAEHLDDFNVQLPSPLGVLADDVVTVEGRSDGRLDYTNFTVIMRASRRMALFTAVNIEGQQSVSVERSNDKWSLDGRIPAEFQLGEDLYSGTLSDAGLRSGMETVSARLDDFRATLVNAERVGKVSQQSDWFMFHDGDIQDELEAARREVVTSLNLVLSQGGLALLPER
ncbi:DNA/RNA non-specific endonuclease [Rhizobium johnstonii]|uniref:DNA/RNA non-specific endonuclease n=1 Tax=Rhizobium johnstonii TaxID=3019933 RepID=UPI003F94B460